MTNTPRTQPATLMEPLWGFNRIKDAVHEKSRIQPADDNPTFLVIATIPAIRIARQIEGDYMDALATAAQRIRELEAQAATLTDEVQGLRQVIAYIDKYAPRANSSCIKPGITLSEAARAQMSEDGDE